MRTLPLLTRRLAEYSSVHQTRGNQLCHSVGVPLIVWSTLGILSQHPIGPYIDGGSGILLLAAIWYLILDWRIAIPFLTVTTGLYFLGRASPVSLLWTGFGVGWILQIVGHAGFEKKSPKFMKNLEHLLIGPLWVFLKCIEALSEKQPR